MFIYYDLSLYESMLYLFHLILCADFFNYNIDIKCVLQECVDTFNIMFKLFKNEFSIYL